MEDVAIRAAGYGMPGVIVDGADVLTCYAAAHRPCRHAAGEGPTLIEGKSDAADRPLLGRPADRNTADEELEAGARATRCAGSRSSSSMRASCHEANERIEARSTGVAVDERDRGGGRRPTRRLHAGCSGPAPRYGYAGERPGPGGEAEL